MSLNVNISERFNSAVLFAQKLCNIFQRQMDSIIVVQKSIDVAERLVNNPVRIVGVVFESLEAASLVSGPIATPLANSCTIQWSVDRLAFHKVRYRKLGDSEWIETEWSETSSIDALIQLTEL